MLPAIFGTARRPDFFRYRNVLVTNDESPGRAGRRRAQPQLLQALRSREVKIENLGVEYSAVPTVTLRPEPIPLDVKIVLIGSTLLYHSSTSSTRTSASCTRSRPTSPRTGTGATNNSLRYAAFVARQVQERGLRYFDRSALARG